MSGYLSDLIARVAEGLTTELSAPWRVLGYLDVGAGDRYVCIWDQGGSYGYEQAEEWGTKTQQIGILVVAGQAASGFDGDMDQYITDITPEIEAALFEAIGLDFVTTTASHTTPPLYLGDGQPRIRIDNGREAIDHSNVGGKVIAKQFVLEVPVRLITENP